MSESECRLYLLTPPIVPDLDLFEEHTKAAFGAGDIACLQIRLKDQDGVAASDETVLAMAERLLPLTQSHESALLINDRPDLAKRAGADGVHIGQSDQSYEKARALLGDEASIGVTCHNSRHLALIAGEAGADYVAFGAFFPSTTKDPIHTAEIELLQWWQLVTTVPCVAIGGIGPENCAPLVNAGADFLAVSASVWNHPDGPAAGVQAINSAIEQA